MKTLCDLTPVRNETVEKGRYTGQTSKFKFIVAGDEWGWNVSRIRYKPAGGEYPPIGEWHGKGFTHLLLTVEDHFGIKVEDAVPIIVAALEKNTGIKFNKKINFKAKPEAIGKLIDDTFKCNYLNMAHNNNRKREPSNVYFRVLKAKATEVEKEDTVDEV